MGLRYNLKYILSTLILFFSCTTLPEDIPGCINSNACNFNPEANEDDGSCSNIIDCLGLCGGVAYVDPCGYCDANTENDCSLECSEILSQLSIDDVIYECDQTETVNGYFCNDLEVIQNIINNNPGSIHIGMDENENKIISVLEYGAQGWLNGRLVSLDLNYNKNVVMPTFCNFKLDTIPENIGELDSLKFLNLKNNKIRTLPYEIGDLENLEKLILESNRLKTFPESIGNLKNLEIVYAHHNQITSLPSRFGELTNLQTLLLNYNNLESLPENIGSLSKLEVLFLNNNQLTSIPISIGQLQILKVLTLDDNLLETLPDKICDLDLTDDGGLAINFTITNNLTCPIYPACVDKILGYQNCEECESGFLLGDGSDGVNGNESECLNMDDWRVLQDIINANDVYSGLRPVDIVHYSFWSKSGEGNRLIELILNSDGLTGNIPESIGDLDSLKLLRMESNQLTGIIPETIGNLSVLQQIKLNSNNLTGNIPASIGSLKNLDLLWLNNNSLSGAIPDNIGNLVKLVKLRLEYNDLTNSMPESIGNLLNIQQLYLRNNKLSGTIPSIFGNLLNLQHLKLQANYFTGEIPESICYIENVRIYLNQNQFCPPYPECLTEDDLGYQNTSLCTE